MVKAIKMGNIQVKFAMPGYRRYNSSFWTNTIYIDNDSLVYAWGNNLQEYYVPLKDIRSITIDGVEYSNKFGQLFNKGEINVIRT